jgi:hypothetical protein
MEIVERMLKTLEGHAASNFYFLWARDESWMFYEYYHEPRWAALWEKVD